MFIPEPITTSGLQAGSETGVTESVAGSLSGNAMGDTFDERVKSLLDAAAAIEPATGQPKPEEVARLRELVEGSGQPPDPRAARRSRSRSRSPPQS
jgi:hypothetical protein